MNNTGQVGVVEIEPVDQDAVGERRIADRQSLAAPNDAARAGFSGQRGDPCHGTLGIRERI
jgi:hypothetical protein